MTSSRLLSLLAVCLLAAVTIAGCASSGPAASADPSDVLGVWEYRSNGSPYLDRGRFRIVRERGGRLDGVLRDSRLGTVDVEDVRLRNGQLHLRIEIQSAYSAQTSVLQISGQVRNDRYTGTFRQPMWDVTTSQNLRRYRQSASGGSLLARRVQESGFQGPAVPLGCTDALVEHDYRCASIP